VSRQVVARASEVVPGTSKIVTVKGRDIGIFNIDGSYFALANRCPHAGGPLCSGRIVPLAMSDGPGHYRLARHQTCPGCVACAARARPRRESLCYSVVAPIGDPGSYQSNDGPPGLSTCPRQR